MKGEGRRTVVKETGCSEDLGGESRELIYESVGRVTAVNVE